MAELPSIRYAPPARYVKPTSWARDWRKRWFRHVGSVHQHYRTLELVAFYSNERDPAARLALQAELEARPNGSAEVLAVCRKTLRDFNNMIGDANRRLAAH